MHDPIEKDDCGQRTLHPGLVECCNGSQCTAMLRDAPSQSHRCAQNHLDCHQCDEGEMSRKTNEKSERKKQMTADLEEEKTLTRGAIFEGFEAQGSKNLKRTGCTWEGCCFE